MESNRGDAPNFEMSNLPEGGSESISSSERSVLSPESSPSRQTAQPQLQVPVDLPTTTPPVTLPQDDQSQPSSAQPVVADHSDRIEKEWVDKAKSIVAATREDPFKQKNEMSKIKAEYIQKRFNKTIKVSGT